MHAITNLMIIFPKDVKSYFQSAAYTSVTTMRPGPVIESGVTVF